MVIEDIAYISLNLGPDVGANDTIVGVRIVPTGREGNVVYARSLNAGEADTGERITLAVGDKLVCPPGSIMVKLEDVDRYAELEPDGYKAITNTVWTWMHLPPAPDEFFFNFMLTMARRLDEAHALCASALRELGDRPDEPFIRTRSRIFDAVGKAELMCVSLSLVMELLDIAPSRLSLSTPVPEEVNDMSNTVRVLRNAFLHLSSLVSGGYLMEERPSRAALVVEQAGADATAILDQGQLVSHGILKYGGYSLDLRQQVIPASVAIRRFIYDAISEAGNTKTHNSTIEMGPVEE